MQNAFVYCVPQSNCLGAFGSQRVFESSRGRGVGEEAGRGAEFVPRSRSDVDMEDCEEREGPGLRLLHHSASSSASSSSARYTQQAEKSYSVSIFTYTSYTSYTHCPSKVWDQRQVFWLSRLQKCREKTINITI